MYPTHLTPLYQNPTQAQSTRRPRVQLGKCFDPRLGFPASLGYFLALTLVELFNNAIHPPIYYTVDQRWLGPGDYNSEDQNSIGVDFFLYSNFSGLSEGEISALLTPPQSLRLQQNKGMIIRDFKPAPTNILHTILALS